MESDKVVDEDVALIDEGKVVAEDGAMETNVASNKMVAEDDGVKDAGKVVLDAEAV